MKKLFYLLIGGIALLMSCAAEPALDTTAAVYADTDRVIADINEQSMGTFDMSWIVKKQVVDTATLNSKEKNIVISHLPVKYFTWNFKDFVNQYPGGWNPTYGYTEQSYWIINTSFLGYSASNAYYSNSPSSNVLSPKTEFIMDGKEYGFQAFFSNDTQNGLPISLMYDVIKDVWSGSVNLDSCHLISGKDTERFIFNPPLTLSFQTTGRKQK